DNGLYQVNESNTIMLSDMPSITISINYADGTLTYTNFGGLPVEKEFYLVVPVSVEYRWGKAETVVVIPVKPGTIIDSKADYIALDRTEVSLETSQTTTLVATVLPESATDKSVTWTSSNEAVATVDANGMVTAIAVGEAIITATTTDGSDLSASCKVTVVPVLAMSIELDKTELDAMEMTEFQLTATVLPENTTNKGVVWSSSDNEIASVDETGLVKMLRVGSVVITATTIDGSDLSASCHITIVVGIDDFEEDNLIVATIGDNIVVKNAKLGSVVNVYASNGALVASEKATDGSVVVEAPVKGVYVVKVGKQTVKVII
ncbi:MAG: Ig domain-containing protein, partial [Muribaculaceae bacterium]|nr:Ig domain-containing protein [Muribaculaceae bacterium]